MKSAASYFSVSTALIKENMRRYWPIPAISFLAYFLTGIFPLLISYASLNNQYYFIESMLSNHYPPFMLAHLFIPVITGVMVFKYIQTPSSVTAMHAMPFTRATLFNSNAISGLALAAAPVILMGLILLAIAKPVYDSYDMNAVTAGTLVDVFAREGVLYWMWESFIIILVLYAVTVFAGIVTGNSLMHLFAGFGFNFLLPGLFAVFTAYCTRFLYGFSMNPDWSSVMLGLSPYLAVFDNGGKFPAALQVIYVIAAIALFAASLFLYYKRKLERATDPLVFGFMIPLISYLIAFFGMTMLGFYFSAVVGSEIYFYAGLLSGALIFYLIGRMIVKKSFRIFDRKTAKSLGIYILLAAVFVSSFAFDLTGYEKRVPDEKRVNGASISFYPAFPPMQGYPGNSAAPVLTTEKNISAMREFHRDILEKNGSWDGNGYTFSPYTFNPYCYIHYDMAGLLDMYRGYAVNYGYARSSRALAEIFESEEYKSSFPFTSPEIVSGLYSIEVNSPNIAGQRIGMITISGGDNIRELLGCLDLDFKAQTYAEAVSFRNSYAEFAFNYDTPEQGYRKIGGYSIPKTYMNTIEWLRNNGYAAQIEITPEMVSAITVRKASPTYSDAVEITDKEQIAVILDTFETMIYTNDYYEGTINLDPGYAQEADVYARDYNFFYSDETAPEFIKELF